MQKATRQQTKTHNTQLVLKTIYEQGEISRAAISRATSLTRPTVSTIVADLMGNNLVVEVGRGPSAGGKRPLLLAIAHDQHQIICLDLGSSEFRGAVVNLQGDVIARQKYAIDNRQEKEALQLVYTLLDDLMAQVTRPLLGIGLGTPGLVNPGKGIIQQAVNLGWHDLPIRQLLAEKYEQSIYVANDSHIAALAEYTYGEHQNSENLIVIKVGRGIGAGIVLKGQPYFGDGFGAGEIGHIVVVNNGITCSCGNVGCLETVSSTRAILQASIISIGHSLNWEELVIEAKCNTAVSKIITTAAQQLGIVLANLIASFNIHQVVIAGRISQLGAEFLTIMKEEAANRMLPAMVANTELTYATSGSDIVILGCAAMVLQQELGII